MTNAAAITPAERAAVSDGLSHHDERVLYERDPAAWARRAEPIWRILLLKADAERRKELMKVACPELRELLGPWLAEYRRLYETDRKAWAELAAPEFRVILMHAEPDRKRELWARMDPELRAALKVLADAETLLEKAA